MSWDGSTLEEALIAALVSGQGVKELAALIAMLPEERRAHYRELWRNHTKRNEKHASDSERDP